jgi:hypothetical protein
MRAEDAVRMLGGSLAIYVVVAACSGGGGGVTRGLPEASADTDGSGTRLKVQRWAGTDGSSLATGMYDSQLKTQCSFALASDGTTRCFPVGMALIGTTFFSDSACSVALAYSPQPPKAGCAAPSYASSAAADNCEGMAAQTVFGVSGPFTATVYGGPPADCAVFQATEAADYTFYSVGAEVPLSTFVQATLTTDP